jgi:glycosyltransferase involved in cell wall biosynthesis
MVDEILSDAGDTALSAPIDLSVVIGTISSERSIRACITSVIESCAALRAEIIVVDASADETASLVRRHFPEVQLISLPTNTLTPVLWSTGIAAARGSRVATTTGHCVVPTGWAQELIAALDSGAAGAGGPILIRERASLVDRAIYFLRYSAFMPRASDEVARVSEIAGDNAMYSRSALDEYPSAMSEGFWEVELHAALRAKGKYLVMVQRAAAEFGDSFTLGVISRHRFAHGRHYGEWRVRQQAESALRIALAAPLVPLVLLYRIAGRVMRSGSRRASFILASPVIFWLAACWAFGEAVGAIRSRRRARQTTTLEATSANRD